MPRRLPLHVERNDVKGKTYLYFRMRKGGPRIRLPDDPTSRLHRGLQCSLDRPTGGPC